MSDYRSSGRGGRSSGRGGYYRPGMTAQQRGASFSGNKPVWFLVIVDILVLGLALNVFALFHHVIPQESGEDIGYTLAPSIPTASLSPIATITPTETASAQGSTSTVEPTATPQPADLGMWGEKFADKFTTGKVEQTDTSYKSRDVNVTITTGRFSDSTYYFADIYVRNLKNFMTALANDKFGVGQRESTPAQAERKNAIIAINGDNYGGRYDGIVVRNGEIKRDKLYKDVLVLYNDGSMKTIAEKSFNLQKDVIETGAWQVWNFGPLLLDANGKAIANISAPDIGGSNPRTAIGYFEPGHYCFVLVDGRATGEKGVKLPELSTLMNQLGCKQAYNLDGGRTSFMVFMNKVVNKPYEGGRSISDIIYIGEAK